MSIDTNLQFIREKIYRVRSAIMYSMSNDIISFPNSIVNAVKVDDEGQLWFVCDKPTYDLDQCPSAFPVRLHFYRKGIYCHLEISGKAEIVNRAYSGATDMNKPLLVKMSIQNVIYTEPQIKQKSQLSRWVEKAGQWIHKHIAIPRNHKPTLDSLQQVNAS